MNPETNLSLYKRWALRLLGQVYLEHRTRPGWGAPLPFFAFRCPVHGVVEDYPHGYARRLECPKCAEEEERARVEKEHDEL